MSRKNVRTFSQNVRTFLLERPYFFLRMYGRFLDFLHNTTKQNLPTKNFFIKTQMNINKK